MLLSVSVWAGHFQDMGPATRDLLHWFSALVALPAVAYAGRPFFRSALGALRARRTNMDVPISIGVILATAMSLFETITGGEHAYFDSAVMLLFFLLVGRYLDRLARGRARSVAERLLTLRATAVAVLGADGTVGYLRPEQVEPGMTVLVAAGERLAVDGLVLEGRSDVDASLITGESLPVAAAPGDTLYAGTLNHSGPLKLQATAVGERTLLGEIARLMSAAEQGRARHVALADRVSRHYAPVVHALAASTFLGWLLLSSVGWQVSLLTAVAVLIITCPCALGLAVPAVQVIASGRLFRRGVLLKSPTALERLAAVDTVVFDKTGTLTRASLTLLPDDARDEDSLKLAAAMAARSRHPLARALARAVPGMVPAEGIREVPGQGLVLDTQEGTVRLGSRSFCGVPDTAPGGDGPELWLARPQRPAVRFAFADALRADAPDVVGALVAQGYRVELLSGDRPPVVGAVADGVGIEHWQAGCTPGDKVRRLEALAAEGRKVLMVGDGLNDAPALAAALVSLSPATAADISQTAADAVFQGDSLLPVLATLRVARRADALVRQNFLLAFVYNALMVPLAIAGWVTPLLAAAAMSASSLIVVGNALRLGRARLP
jgi:Cu2+-exporting ATPase